MKLQTICIFLSACAHRTPTRYVQQRCRILILSDAVCVCVCGFSEKRCDRQPFSLKKKNVVPQMARFAYLSTEIKHLKNDMSCTHTLLRLY